MKEKNIIIKDWGGGESVFSTQEFVERFGPSEDSHHQQYNFILKLTQTLIDNGTLDENDIYNNGYGLFDYLNCAELRIEQSTRGRR